MINESMVCTCSVGYMRAGIGNERLVVCLSEYLPLRIVFVYRISSMSMFRKLRRSPRVKVVVLPAVSFQPVPTEAAGRVGIWSR